MDQMVAGLYFDKATKTGVFIRKQHPAWQAGKLNLPGGHVKGNEIACRAMAREFQEETGIVTTPDEWISTVVLVGKDWQVEFFVAYGDPGLAKTMTDEHVELYGITNLPADVLYNLRWIIPMSLDESVSFPLFVVSN